MHCVSSDWWLERQQGSLHGRRQKDSSVGVVTAETGLAVWVFGYDIVSKTGVPVNAVDNCRFYLLYYYICK